MIAVQLEVLEVTGVDGLPQDLRTALTVYGHTVYVAGGLTMESPVRLSQVPQDAEVAVALLPAQVEGAGEPSPLALARVPAAALGCEEKGRATGPRRWRGWLPVEGLEAGAGEVAPQVCLSVLLEGPEGETDEEAAQEEQPEEAHPRPLPVCQAATMEQSDEEAAQVNPTLSHGHIVAVEEQENEVAEEAPLLCITSTPSFSHFCSEQALQEEHEPEKSLPVRKGSSGFSEGSLWSERNSTGSIPRFGSFKLPSSSPTLLAHVEEQQIAVEGPRQVLLETELPGQVSSPRVQAARRRPSPARLSPTRLPAKPAALGEIVWPWFDEASNVALLDAPELDMNSSLDAPSSPLMSPLSPSATMRPSGGSPRSRLSSRASSPTRHESPQKRPASEPPSPTRKRLDSRPPSPPRPQRFGPELAAEAAKQWLWGQEAKISSEASAQPLCRTNTEGSVVSEAELMHSVVGHLYTQLVQAASGAMLERWTSTFDALVQELTRGATFCREAELLVAVDRSTEIDLSSEFPPEKRQAQRDHAVAVQAETQARAAELRSGGLAQACNHYSI